MLRVAAFLLLALPAAASTPKTWVPVRWTSTDPASLSLLKDTPVNCLLMEWSASAPLTAFTEAAAAQGIAPLAVLRPGADSVAQARAVAASKMQGVVLEGDFPEGSAASVRAAVGALPVIEITARRRMPLGGSAPVMGTYQGVWAGIQITDNGKTKAAPSGSAWIDTNSGFLRAVRAWGPAEIWLANLPPAGTVVTAERYLQMIGDAALVGARWVIAFDPDFSRRLYAHDAKTMVEWRRMIQLLGYFESHSEWRSLRSGGKLALVQDTQGGGLLSGGILDMIATKHTPVQSIPPQRLTAESLRGDTMAVNIDAASLDPHQKEILTQFRKSGGTVLTGPAGWRDTAPATDAKITLDDKELKRIDEMWHDMQAMIGRKNLGARLFNVSSMLSNLLTTEDGKQLYVQLLNYADYPVENVTVHVLGTWAHAVLMTSDGKERVLEVYKNDEGTGVDVDSVALAATIRLY